MQPDIRELLDDAGEEGDRHDDAEVGRHEQTVEGNVAGERHELHAALTHAKGDHAAHGALAQGCGRLAIGRAIGSLGRHIKILAGRAG